MFQAIKLTALFLAGFLFFVPTIAAQEKEAADYKIEDGKVGVDFNKDKNETTVKLNEMLILESKSESLSMIAVGSYVGQKPSASPSEILFMLNASSQKRRYQVEPQLIVTADGEVIRTRKMKNYGSRKDGERIIEPLLTMMPYDVMLKMTKAKKVVFKINETEYKLTESNLEHLRNFAGRLIP